MANVLSSVCMDCYYVFVAMLCDGVDAHDTQGKLSSAYPALLLS
ncbi:hypothetical protein PF003_g30193 [Phytophthora fragariae]|nr:hypothetical protein PF003_g30193 [Phytophthora fragariae]